MSKTILVIAAHPDDEILGCGGAMARHSAEGDKVYTLIMGEGIAARDGISLEDRNEAQEKLLRSAIQANKTVGASLLEFQKLADNRMDQLCLLDIVKLIEAQIELYKPTVIYTHYPQDLNIDHRLTSQAVITACRPLPGFCVKEILFFEVISSTEWQLAGVDPFAPNYFVDISNFLELKLEALKAYESEMRSWPHARSLENVAHLAHFRGASLGLNAAESFMLGRGVR